MWRHAPDHSQPDKDVNAETDDDDDVNCGDDERCFFFCLFLTLGYVNM